MRSPSEPLRLRPHVDVSAIARFVDHDSESTINSQLIVFLFPFSLFYTAQTGKAPGDNWWQTVFEQECCADHEQARQARSTPRCKHRKAGAYDQSDCHASSSLRDAHRCDRPGTPDISAMLCFVRGESRSVRACVQGYLLTMSVHAATPGDAEGGAGVRGS